MSIWQEINAANAQTIDTVSQSLVQVQDATGSIGAGTIWHEDGLIITNAHVVLGRRDLRQNLEVVLGDGSVFPTEVLAVDKKRDIAALVIDAHKLPTIQIGNSDALVPGSWVSAIGHPWGVADAVTSGVVIGKGKDLPERVDHYEWIALNLTLRPGHSGGPLINKQGELVGINTMIRGPEVGFAIPVNTVKHFLQQAIKSRQPKPASSPPPHESTIVV